MKKSLIAAMVFASASLAGTAAIAQTTAVSTAPVVGNTPQSIFLTDGAGFFGDVFNANNSGSTFSDRFNFNVASTGSGGGTGGGTGGTGGTGGGAGGGSGSGTSLDAIVSSISRTANTGLAITGLSLFNSSGTLVTSGTSLQSGPIDVWTVKGDNLSAGSYYLQVSGNLVSASSAAFGGALSMAAPVPEPETYGMMLAGLGALGFLARRRGSGKAA